MPSKSPAMHHLMEAVDHGWHMPGGKGPSKAVAHEFVQADKASGKFAGGGAVNKGYLSKSENFAQGGAVLGRTRDFMKTQDEFRDPDEGNPAADADQMYAKSGEGAGNGAYGSAPPATGKSLSPVKPRG